MKVGRFKLDTAEDLRRNGIRDEDELLWDLAAESLKSKDWIGFKKGYLRKTKEKNRAVFFKKTRRHFMLVNEFMVYRNDRSDDFPKAAYNLLFVKGIGIVGRNSFVMDFEDGTRSGVLIATSHAEATLWVQAIRARLQLIKTPEYVSKREKKKRLVRRMSSNLIDIDTNEDFSNAKHRRKRTEDNWLSLFDSLFDSAAAAVVTTKKDDKRQYIIAEIMSTEQNYVDSLKTLMNVYRRVATENAGRFGWLSTKSIGIVFDKLIPLAMMHEKLLSDIKRVVEKRITNASSRSVPLSSTNEGEDPFSFVPSAYSAGLLPTTKSIDKKDLFDLAFDSPSFQMDDKLKKPRKIDETTLISDVTQDLVNVFSVSSPKNHSHPPPLPPRNNSSKDVKSSPDLLNIITRVPTGFGGYKPTKESSPTIRFAAQLSAERRARHQRSPSQHRTETSLVSPKKKTEECETVEEAIGVVFATYAHFFLMYKDYIHSYEDRISHLRRKIKTKTSWGKFCATQKNTHGLDIFSLLIQPVQRMPRYRLLILELLKSTPDDATYRKSLRDALSNLERALEISNSA